MDELDFSLKFRHFACTFNFLSAPNGSYVMILRESAGIGPLFEDAPSIGHCGFLFFDNQVKISTKRSEDTAISKPFACTARSIKVKCVKYWVYTGSVSLICVSYRLSQ